MPLTRSKTRVANLILNIRARPLSRSTALFLAAIIVIPALLAWLALDSHPALQRQADLSPDKIAEAKSQLAMNDPRRLRSGSIALARLNQKQLDLALNYAAKQLVNGSAELKIGKQSARVRATVPLPAIGRYVNLTLVLVQNGKLPKIASARLGSLPIPAWLAHALADRFIAALIPENERKTLSSTLKQIEFKPGVMTATYRWQYDLPTKLSAIVWGNQLDRQRIDIYRAKIAEVMRTARQPVSLTVIAGPLFRQAAERSVQGDPIAENRAVVLLMALYCTRRELGRYIAATKIGQFPNWQPALLNGRDDLGKHFSVSALLAAYAGTPLADAVGLYKEIQDSRGGSGFSFNDIAADLAGRRLGEMAVADPDQAKRLQTRMVNAQESDFMPATADLPEFMPETEFQQRFGGLQGENYRQMLEKIHQRINALPLYQKD